VLQKSCVFDRDLDGESHFFPVISTRIKNKKKKGCTIMGLIYKTRRAQETRKFNFGSHQHHQREQHEIEYYVDNMRVMIR
jgi:hypothetical protein